MTSNAPLRIVAHVQALKRGKHSCIKMQEDYNTHGKDSFEFGEIKKFPDKYSCMFAERKMIESTEFLYNKNSKNEEDCIREKINSLTKDQKQELIDLGKKVDLIIGQHERFSKIKITQPDSLK